MYRKLTKQELETLQNQGCTADDWGNIEVVEDFLPDFIKNVQFFGHNKMGKFNKIFKLENGVKRHSGIFNATLHNCVIENDVYIADIHNVIANYEIQQGSFLTNIGTLSKTPKTAFGNGVLVATVNENGERKIPIFEQISAQIAHILVFYREKTELQNKILAQISNFCNNIMNIERGIVGEQAKILNCKAILNVKIGAGAIVSGAELLENGTISSDLTTITLVGAGVIAKDFIFAKGVKIIDGTVIERCFVGENCVISKHFSATDCLFFANCEMMNGEAVSVFAAPYSVSHHKSSLMIACSLSFANIGSGTNMSNHAYKLGAVHQGVMERGCKFGSNSYLLFPAHIGAYTMILGSHKNHPDIDDLPFSYLVEENGQSILIPAVNIFRLGTLRDVKKWENRDKRCGKKLDFITFDFFNPCIINKIERGIEILKNLTEKNPDAEFYEYGNCKIHRHSAKKALTYYQDALTVFLGDFVCEKTFVAGALHSTPIRAQKSEWVDLAGFVLPKSELENVENFAEFSENYQKYLDKFVANFLDFENKTKIKLLLENYISVLKTLKIRLLKEADSEYFGVARIGYRNDFEQVRGTIESNEFLQNISENFDKKIEKAEKMIENPIVEKL
ncbi:MAG: DUF4954 family protein [Prevotellaceae bacterium]|jgi:carbonic anhydrase/acetyltransferase-like protein (isoleucine patch superfamily)|nr:DUF4954 family protein [Prevotellaceae bacterium]